MFRASSGRRIHAPRRRTLALATGIALIANLTILVLEPALAGGRNPLCDVPVEANLTLAADLNCSAGQGLVVDGQSGITIDLNGHRIFGDSSAYRFGISILNSTRVKVINGAIDGFYVQIAVQDSSSLTFSNLAVTTKNGAVDGVSGITLSQSGGVTIDRVVAVDATTFATTVGFELAGINGKVKISNSSARDFARGVRVEGAGPGSAVTLANNIIVGSSGEGLYYTDNVGTLTVTDSTIVDNGSGLIISCDDGLASGPYGPVTVTGNRIIRNDGVGVELDYCPSGKSTISGNVSASNETGFYSYDLPNAMWSGNRAAGNELNGFEINEAEGSTFKGNRADSNGWFGFDLSDDVVEPPAAITANFARGNGDGGFTDDAEDLTDLSSGNVAFGNGDGSDEDQCLNVTCVGHTPSTDTVACGAEVSSSIVLSEDLDCSGESGAALTIPSGASRVTIDLNGYTLMVNDVGIQLEGPGPTKSITIRNGYLDGASGSGGGMGVLVSADGSSVLLENVLSDGSDPMLQTDERDLGDSYDNTGGVTLTANDIVYNGTDDYAIYAYSDTVGDPSTEPVVPPGLPNTVKMLGSLTGPTGIGPYANIVKVDRSVILKDGIAGEDGSVVTNSIAVGYYGVSLYCALEGTASLSGNLLIGQPNTGSNGARLFHCGGGTISNNTAIGAGYLGGSGFYADTADAMKWTGNRAFGNFNGFELVFDVDSAVLKGNSGDGNYNDGFYLVGIGAGNTFSGNFARGNGYIGFESVTTTMNGSGNIAFGNGADNCVQVTCKLPA